MAAGSQQVVGQHARRHGQAAAGKLLIHRERTTDT